MVTTVLFLLSILCLTAAWAGPIPDPTADPQGFLTTILDAIKDGSGRYIAAVAVIGLVGLLKVYGKKVFPKIEQGKWAWTAAVIIGILLKFGDFLQTSTAFTAKGVIAVIMEGAFWGLGGSALWKGVSEYKEAKKLPPPVPGK